jgi:hypothetical protein
MANQDINIRIKATDEASAVINKVKQEIKAVEGAGAGIGKGVGAGATAATGPLAGLKNALSGVSDKFNELSGAGGMLGNSLGNISSTLSGLISPATMAIAAIGALVLGLKAAVDEAIAAEETWTRVSNVLGNTGQNTDEAVAKVQELGNAMQELRGIDGEAIGEQFATLKTSIDDVDNAYRATIDLQALMQKGGVKEKAAMKALEDAYAGMPELLGGLTTETKAYYDANRDLMSDQELAAGLIQEVESAYGGLLTATQSNAEKTRELAGEWEDFKATIGNLVLPALAELNSAISGFISLGTSVVTAIGNISNSFKNIIPPEVFAKLKEAYDWMQKINKFSPMNIMSGKTLFNAAAKIGKAKDVKDQSYAEKLINKQLQYFGTAKPNIAAKFDLENAMKQAATEKTIFEYKNKRAMTAKEELATQEKILAAGRAQGKSLKELAPVLSQINALKQQSQKPTTGATGGKKAVDSGYGKAMFGIERAETNAALSGKQYSFEQKINALVAARGQLNKNAKDYQQKLLEIDKQIVTVKKQQTEATKSNATAQKAAADAAAQQAQEVNDAYKRGQSEATSEWSAMMDRQKEELSQFGNEQMKLADDYKKKYKDSSESISKLQTERNALEQQYNQAVIMGTLTIEQRAELLKDHANVMRSISDDEKDSIRNAADALDQQTEMFIVMNKLSDMDADILRYKTDQSKLAQGLVTDTREYVSLVASGYKFQEMLKEEYGLTIEQAQGLNKVQLEGIKKRKDMEKDLADFKAETSLKEQMGFDTKGAKRELANKLQEKALITKSMKDAMAARRAEAAADAEDKRLQDIEDAKQLAQTSYESLKTATSDALMQGFNEGGKAGIKAFMNYFKQQLMKTTADSLATAMLKGGGTGELSLMGLMSSGGTGGSTYDAAKAYMEAARGGNAISMTPGLSGAAGDLLLSGKSGGSVAPIGAAMTSIATKGEAAQIAKEVSKNEFATGWKNFDMLARKSNPFAEGWKNFEALAGAGKKTNIASIAQGFGGGIGSLAEGMGGSVAGGAAKAGGGFLSKLFGGGGAGGGAMGFLGKAMPYLGAGMMIASLFDKGAGAPVSGVDKLPQNAAPNVFGGGLDVLRGSDAFTRAAFSSRNVTGAVTAGMAERRFGEQPQQVEVTVKPSEMFDVEVSQRTGESVRRSTAGGTPNRTGFNL